MTTFFTSDTHFGHKNIIKHADRPFANTREMDEAMIANWNEVVGPQDTVYHLGDVFVYCDVEYAIEVRERLNGRICILRGNHDQIADKLMRRSDVTGFRWIKDYYKVKHPDPEPLRPDSGHGDKQHIVLFHYAMRTWHHKRRGVWHLYGHSHGQLWDIPDDLSVDIGVDVWDFKPVSYEELKEHFRQKMAKGAA